TKLKLIIGDADVQSITINAVGNTDVINVNTKHFQTTLNGTGNVNAAGKADSVAVVITGAGSVNFKKLEAKDTTVRITGSGSAEVNASSSLDSTITGTGSIRYSGNPAHTKQNITGVGSVNPA